MADHPLRPATDRRLGRPLPHQLANLTSATPIARGLAIPRFLPQDSCGISVTFATLSPTTGYVPMHYSPVRHSQPPKGSTVRLACVKHAASVQSEPGSNSSVQSLLTLALTLSSKPLHSSEFLLTCVSIRFYFRFSQTTLRCPDHSTQCPHLKAVSNLLKNCFYYHFY